MSDLPQENNTPIPAGTPPETPPSAPVVVPPPLPPTPVPPAPVVAPVSSGTTVTVNVVTTPAAPAVITPPAPVVVEPVVVTPPAVPEPPVPIPPAVPEAAPAEPQPPVPTPPTPADFVAPPSPAPVEPVPPTPPVPAPPTEPVPPATPEPAPVIPPAPVVPQAPIPPAPANTATPTPTPSKRSFWSMFSKKPAAPKKEVVAATPAPIAVETPVVAPVAPTPVPTDTTATLATFANGDAPIKGKIISAGDLKKEEEEKKEKARILIEQTKREMEEEKIAKQKGQKPASVVAKKPVLNKTSGGMEKLIAAITHMGMGKERMQFTSNLATMLGAGLPLVDSLQTLKAETRNKGFKQVVKRIVDRVENGSPLWRAMDSENIFSLHAIALVRIGEEAGNLAKNMEYLALQETKDHELVQKVKMAMIYPIIVLSIMFVVVMGLGLFVLPNLIGVLTSLHVALPLPTRIVIAFSNAFTNYGLIIVPGSIIFIIVFIILAKFTPMKVPVQWVVFRIPGIGSLLRDATIARFGVILGGLLQAGVPVLDAVQSLVQVTSILVYKHFYEKLREHITVGDSFAKSFTAIKHSEKLLPPSVQQLVITGEKSGALSLIMLKIADIYDKKASETAQKLPVILEPILLLVIGVLVGTIAIAIIVPIYSIVGNVGRS